MKKTMIVLSFGLFASSAMAQSSVTLYGIIDTGLTYVTNEAGSHNFKEDDGIYYGNRWGLKGTEDLGGGLSAVFNLENGFSLGTGKFEQFGAEFGRQAYVGLQSKQYGSVTLGHQYDAGTEYFMYNCLGLGACVTGYGGHLGNLDGQLFGLRLDNAVKYKSPDLYGFQILAMYAFGNTAGNFHQNSGYSGGISYAGGPLYAAAYYTRINNPNTLNGTDPYGQLGVTSLLGQTVATVGANGAVTDNFSATSFALDSKSIYGAGVSYKLGKLTGKADVVDTQMKGYGQTATLRVYEGGATYDFAPDIHGIIDYQFSQLEGAHWNQFSIGASYNLSKRTTLYAGTDFLKAHGANAVIGDSFQPSTTDRQIDARIGMMHMF